MHGTSGMGLCSLRIQKAMSFDPSSCEPEIRKKVAAGNVAVKDYFVVYDGKRIC